MQWVGMHLVAHGVGRVGEVLEGGVPLNAVLGAQRLALFLGAVHVNNRDAAIPADKGTWQHRRKNTDNFRVFSQLSSNSQLKKWGVCALCQ